METSPLASRASRLEVTSGSEVACRTGASQNTRPITAASCKARFWEAGSASIRAPRTAKTVSGSAAGSVPATRQPEPLRTNIPPSINRRMISSRNKGLPSAVPTRSRRSVDGSSLPSRISLSSVVLCCAVNARSARTATASRPSPNSGCVLRSSGRAVVTRSNGPVDRARSRSTIATRRPPAQCKSSNMRITGPAAA